MGYIYEKRLEQARLSFVRIVNSNSPIRAAAKLLPYNLSLMTIGLAGIKAADVENFIYENYDNAEEEYNYMSKLKEPTIDWFDKLFYKKKRHPQILEERKRERLNKLAKVKNQYIYWKVLKEEFKNRKSLYKKAVEKDRVDYYRPAAEYRDRTGYSMLMVDYEKQFILGCPFDSFEFIEDAYGRACRCEKKT